MGDEEGRRFSRLSQPFEVKYHLYGDLMQTWKAVRTLDLSASGMRFEGSDLVEDGSQLEVQLAIPSRQRPLILRGQVIWSKVLSSRIVECGVEFLETTPEQAAYIDELVQFFHRGMGPGPAR